MAFTYGLEAKIEIWTYCVKVSLCERKKINYVKEVIISLNAFSTCSTIVFQRSTYTCDLQYWSRVAKIQTFQSTP